MPASRILIKNMVCHRCVLNVRGILTRLGIPFGEVSIGEVELEAPLLEKEKNLLKSALDEAGLELIDSHGGGLIEKIKALIIRKARNEAGEKERRMKLSSYLTGQLHHEYTYLSSLFSDVEGRTIENYYILQRIERAKELLVYGEMNLSEIADELDYSSVAHLSGQFKKVTGLTPSHFRKIGAAKRKMLDKV